MVHNTFRSLGKSANQSTPFRSPTPSITVRSGRSRKGKILKTRLGYPNGMRATCANSGERLVDRYIL